MPGLIIKKQPPTFRAELDSLNWVEICLALNLDFQYLHSANILRSSVLK